VDIGMLGRFFGRGAGGNWRPPGQELAFASQAGFDTLQIRSDRHAIEDELGIDAAELGRLFDEHGVEPVLELLVRYDEDGGAAMRALEATLPDLQTIGVLRVHVHPVGHVGTAALTADLADAAAAADDAGLLLGIEHNAPGHRLLTRLEEVESLLDAVPRLWLVWDINHTPAEDVAGYLALRERFSLVHASDTPLPETNWHLPLGRGNVDLAPLRTFDDVPVILEIGGLPHSGGPGLDTDDELLDSLARLRG
jgi:L-ribulose-5-phosphate 3-epimerase